MTQQPLPTLDQVFADDGYLADAFSGYQPREGQIKMARLVQEAINDQRTLVIEAGTGVGKTFGYLAPVLLSGKRALISTGTKHLQDQLFHRDLPRLRQILGMQVDIALLKGRSNYLCPYRLELAEQTPFRDKRWAKAFANIQSWSEKSIDGDKAGCAAVGDDHPIWSLVTSTNDNCLGRECPYFDQCPVVNARERAARADVVVINHHLFCADVALKQTGFAELLPQADVVVFDEAHQLPEIAGNFFGTHLTARQFLDLIADIGTEAKTVTAAAALPDAAHAFKQSVEQTQKGLAQLPDARCGWAEVADDPKVQTVFESLTESLDALVTELKAAAPRSKGLENLYARGEQLRQQLADFRAEVVDSDSNSVRWLEVHSKSFALHTTPVNAAGEFKQQIESAPRTWIMTSATLAAGTDFSHFTRRMFLADTRCYQVESPFDYQKQALLYLPTDIPVPVGPNGARDHTLAALRRVYPLLKASQGRAFLLFTSHRALELAAETLSAHLTGLTLLVQGTQSKSALLDEFRACGNGVLLGTQSFWEGVDVRGEALSMVMIDKIPFAAPGDPVRQAREARLKDKGLSPFVHMALPEAIITLKQGVGRLIRDVEDQGVLVLCDPRLTAKPYGRQVLNALPPMAQTHQFAAAKEKIERDVAPAVHSAAAN